MKRFRFTGKKRSVFILLLASYLVILIVSLLSNLAFVMRSKDILDDEVIRANNACLEQLQQRLDNVLESVESICTELSLDTRIRSLVNQQWARRSLNESYLTVEVMDRLSVAEFTSGYIKDLFLIMLDKEYVITPRGRYTAREYYDKLFPDGCELRFEGWMLMQKRASYREFRTISTGLSRERHELFYWYGLPVEKEGDRIAVMGVVFDEGQLSALLSESEWLPNSSLAILDGEDNVICYGHNDISPWLEAEGRQNGEHVIRRVDESDYYEFSIDSRLSDWKYISMAPVEIYLDAENRLFRTFWTLLFSFAAIGGALAFMLANVNYSPINRLVRLLGSGGVTEDDDSGNEFYIIENSISHVIDENRSLSRVVKEQDAAIKSNDLVRVFQGIVTDDGEIEAVLRAHGMKLSHTHFCVVVLDVAKDGDSEKAGLHRGREHAVSMVGQKASGSYAYTHAVTNEAAVFLFNVPNYVLAEQYVISLFNEIVTLAQTDGIAFSVGISGIYEGFGGIYLGFTEADELNQFGLLTCRAGVISAADSPRTRDFAVSTILEEQKLANMLRANSYDEARKLFNHILDIKFSWPGLPMQAVKCNLYGLIYTIINAITDIRVPDKYDMIEGMQPVYKLLRCNTVGELRREMTAILDDLSAIAAVSETGGAEGAVGLVEEAAEYIDKRYGDQALSVGHVADALSVSAVMLTRAFKKVLNISALDYIHRCRLREAKRLMSTTDKSLKAIAESAGYSNSVTFIRVFKRYEGITPSQYREREAGLTE